MSTNINNVITLSSTLVLRCEGLPAKDRLPENCSVPDLIQPGARLGLSQVRWSGIWSGNALYDGTFAAFCACTEGEADLVLIWESGDLSGIRIKGGAFAEHRVVYSLGEPL